METLGKLLSRCGGVSRRQAVTEIRSGAVTVNGSVVTEPATRIGELDEVRFRSRLLERADAEQWVVMLNKPAGYVCTAADPHAERKALDLIVPAPPVRLFSAGRLDKESRGLIIFSNDGDLVAELTHPRFRILKRYEVTLAGELSPASLKRLLAGIPDDGEILKAESIRALGKCRYELILNEGRKREIRRMTAACGAPTLDLCRVAMGGLELGTLPEGAWRRLAPEEIALLRQRENSRSAMAYGSKMQKSGKIQ